jgi:small-conductance mechanosensitive channel
MVPGDEVECPRCGAPLEDSAWIDETQDEALEEFVERSHEKLIKAGTSGAELAFGVGCTLEVITVGLIMLFIFLVITKTWTVIAVILFILTLISILISSILAIRAREAATRSTYEREVKPEIERFNSYHGLSQDEFRVQAAEILPEDSPVLQYSSRKSIQD